MSETAIALRALERRFGDVTAVDGVDLEVAQGAFLVLLGPSGCGKTTILRMLAGLEAPTGGEILLNGRLVASGARGIVVPPGRRGIGLVFQSYALWPHMTVRGNVEWPLKVAGWPAAKRRARVDETLSLLGIAPLADRYPSAVSGGQQQRVAIARMLGPGPKVLLFDEPLSNLDAKLRVEMRTELLRVHRVSGATSVYVTHDQVEAMTMATEVAVMRDGKVEQLGPPRAVLERPETAFVATFLGTPPGNLIPAHAVGGRYVFKGLHLGPAPDGAANAYLLYRPQDVRIGGPPRPAAVPAQLAEVSPLAGRVVVTVLVDGQRVSAVTDRLPQVEVGDLIQLELPSAPAAVFAADGRRLE